MKSAPMDSEAHPGSHVPMGLLKQDNILSLLHKCWCKTQVDAHSQLMPFQSTISLMYFQVYCGYLSFLIKWMKIM